MEKEYHNQQIRNFRRNRKEKLIKVLGSKCSLCGYNKCLGALEFHHINSKDKEYTLSSGNCHNLEKDLLEAKKCILFCANCHREIHNLNLFSEEDLYKKQCYNEEYAFSLLQNQKKRYYCKDCGKEITKYSDTGLCQSCYKKTLRKVQRPNREELKRLIRILPFTQIANQYGVTDNSIRKWCDKENLPRKKSDIEKYTDVQWSKI